MTNSDYIRWAADVIGERPAAIVANLAGRGIVVTKNLVRQVLKTRRRADRALEAKKVETKAVNRSAEIRLLLADGLKPAAIKKALADRGIEVSENLIDTVRKQDRRWKEKQAAEAAAAKAQAVQEALVFGQPGNRTFLEKVLWQMWLRWLGVIPDWTESEMAEHHGPCPMDELAIPTKGRLAASKNINTFDVVLTRRLVLEMPSFYPGLRRRPAYCYEMPTEAELKFDWLKQQEIEEADRGYGEFAAEIKKSFKPRPVEGESSSGRV